MFDGPYSYVQVPFKTFCPENDKIHLYKVRPHLSKPLLEMFEHFSVALKIAECLIELPTFSKACGASIF